METSLSALSHRLSLTMHSGTNTQRWHTTSIKFKWPMRGMIITEQTYSLLSSALTNAVTCRAKRIEKEDALQQQFWSKSAKANVPSPSLPSEDPIAAKAPRSVAGSIAETTNTQVLKERLDRLEVELALEREKRVKVEAELTELVTKSSGK